MSNNKRSLDHDSDNESNYRQRKAHFNGGSVFEFVRILPEFYNQLRRENAFDYVTGNDQRYQTHMANEPTLVSVIKSLILPDFTSTVEDWIGSLRMKESEKLDRLIVASPWLPYKWTNRPLPTTTMECSPKGASPHLPTIQLSP